MSRQSKMLALAGVLVVLGLAAYWSMSNRSSAVVQYGVSDSPSAVPAAMDAQAEAPTRNAAATDPGDFARPEEMDAVAESDTAEAPKRADRQRTTRRRSSRGDRTESAQDDEPTDNTENKPKFSGARYAPNP